ncbi:MAG: heme-binding protein [Lachnospiraceae bacterium]|nr:heme-binding protein [Lachnospiraceae bacterium]
MTVEELIKVLDMQEEILQFSHFTNGDAWELGSLIAVEAGRRGLPVAVSIRLNNGYTVFQYGSDGTGLYNEDMLTRKHETVKYTEQSSMHLYLRLRLSEKTQEDMQLPTSKYAAVGGGFPIRVEEVGVIGSVTVSGIGHVADHDLIVNCISRYLHVDEVPRIRAL